MQVTNATWTHEEKQIAKTAFQRAYDRETTALLQEVQSQIHGLTELGDLWRLHDFLSARRHDIDGKYDERDSMLLIVFAQLVREGWLSMDDLQGLEVTKLRKVSALARM
jgi:hypothetical protein